VSDVVGYRAYVSEDLVTGEGVAVELPVASLPLRLVGGLIDWFLYLSALLVVVVAESGSLTVSSEAVAATVATLDIIVCLVVLPATVEIVSRGRSLGKLAMGLRIARDDGGRISARHSIVRALIGFVEFFFPLLPGGGVPIVVGLISSRSKRLGDMAAGTFAINERVSLRMPAALPMPPHLGMWAMHADIAAVPPSLAIAVRQFLGRAAQLTPVVRDQVGRQLYASVMTYVSPPPPPTHHEWVLVAVLVDRRRRDAERLAREDARRARVVPVDRLA
jgi:uncharacterized RDD family membrane protein YckC